MSEAASGGRASGAAMAVMARVAVAGAVGVVWVGASCGCQSSGRPWVEGAAYPQERAVSRVLDVHVLRDTTKISLTNTSAEPIGPGTLWLNGRYGREIEQIAVGDRETYTLGTFRDEFGDAFRGGGFWAMERPDVLVRAEVESGDDLVGLIVIRRDEED